MKYSSVELGIEANLTRYDVNPLNSSHTPGAFNATFQNIPSLEAACAVT